MEGVWPKAFQVALEAFPDIDPERAAADLSVRFDAAAGRFELEFLGVQVAVTWPAGEVSTLEGGCVTEAGALIVLHYLLGQGGEAEKGEWIAYRDLPGGRNYEAAFRREAEMRLAAALGGDLAPWRLMAEERGFILQDYGDLAFVWRALPHVPLLFVLTAADEEFPPDARILYDRSAGSWLHSEDLAVLGELASYALTGHFLCD